MELHKILSDFATALRKGCTGSEQKKKNENAVKPLSALLPQ